ncbi:MAG TPA: hypothetical protein VNU84_08185 [Candidatus Acidoferrum sp.]|jgi:hypothetical protein|nr:hypothetical protein [Candidatus Acidoferrum sp.]
MALDPNHHLQTARELAILRVLVLHAQERCHPAGTPETGIALDNLAKHSWHDEEHRVVYECVLALASHNRNFPLREEMAAEATRKGHPDVDWDLYFAPPGPDTDLAILVESLKPVPGR